LSTTSQNSLTQRPLTPSSRTRSHWWYTLRRSISSKVWKNAVGANTLAPTFSYTIDLDCVTLQTKQIVSRYSTVGYWIANNFGPQCLYRYVPQGPTYAVLFRNTATKNSSRPALGFTQSPIQWVPVVKLTTHHSPPAGAELKKMWISTFIPPYVFMA
jgi:hypothetical protein